MRVVVINESTQPIRTVATAIALMATAHEAIAAVVTSFAIMFPGVEFAVAQDIALLPKPQHGGLQRCRALVHNGPDREPTIRAGRMGEFHPKGTKFTAFNLLEVFPKVNVGIATTTGPLTMQQGAVVKHLIPRLGKQGPMMS